MYDSLRPGYPCAPKGMGRGEQLSEKNKKQTIQWKNMRTPVEGGQLYRSIEAPCILNGIGNGFSAGRVSVVV